MSERPPRILIADDDDGDRRQIARLIRQARFRCELTEADDLAGAEAACAAVPFDCAIIDYRMPGADGLQGIGALRRRYPHLAIVMVTGQGDELIASEAIKLGAADYVPKSQLSPGYLSHVLRNAIRKAELERLVADQRAELERFAHVLAHDLKSPIHQIQYLVRFIERDVREALYEKLQADCDKLVATAQRMEALINTLQQYTRIDRDVVFGRTSLQDALDDCLRDLAREIAERKARVHYGELPVVYGNGPLLTQLFQNLVGNGLKYCRADCPEISVKVVQQDEVYAIGVEDNGIGIAEEQRAAIFEPFKRLHSADEFDGTGLGLATCRKIVERHGGSLWCEGGGNGGTIFWFTLPSADGSRIVSDYQSN